MKQRYLVLLVSLALVLVSGCSDQTQVTGPDSGIDPPDVQLVQRPQFVDLRPMAEIEASVIRLSAAEQLQKKPPKPPDDPPGGEDPNPNPPHKYAYVVGISDYEGTLNDLQFADDDAREIKSYLQGEGFTVQSDVDRGATAQAIVDGLNWLAAQAQPGDEIAFFYSGHGDKFGADGSSIITTDLYYVTHGYIMNIINSADCGKVLVMLDACKIGNFLSDGQDGSVVATASNNTYSYDAPDLGNGAWTYYFLEGTGNLVFAEDIAAYAEAGMKAWAKIYKLRVSPAHTDNYTGSFDI